MIRGRQSMRSRSAMLCTARRVRSRCGTEIWQRQAATRTCCSTTRSGMLWRIGSCTAGAIRERLLSVGAMSPPDCACCDRVSKSLAKPGSRLRGSCGSPRPIWPRVWERPGRSLTHLTPSTTRSPAPSVPKSSGPLPSCCIKGELVLLQDAAPQAAAAKDYFQRAIDWAHRQGALLWELRAVTSLARLRRDQGRSAEALALLQPVYDRFTEGFETADLKAARALLDSLQQLW